ncbi:MAG: hypothetical protein WCD25_06245, partial [Pseudolabrys sp.]
TAISNRIRFLWLTAWGPINLLTLFTSESTQTKRRANSSNKACDQEGGAYPLLALGGHELLHRTCPL